ncbi:uncharacterized protein LOC129778333 [Toxorhynchites rutilus septentrionalis]|uniref:uncharacterized protein LOC129778333 n=1 Tax=Toxorhynchites rutilus septentrionalis TaxID=329112 RepID=UPI00247A893F|nr:uncharacterized protein LOC129778333 [Toxorhynchites rutilus septentrionalis]XP_055641172.1 uncharacterized protein LOC129778333 [Toxorhynchites rutilus septentrionalis]
MSPPSSKSNSDQLDQIMSIDVLEIEQCLFSVPEEFFLREPSDHEDECVSTATSESLTIPSVPSFTKWEMLFDQNLASEIIEKLCFNEMLLISTHKNEIVGGLVFHIELVADEVIAVFCDSQFSIGDGKTAQCELLALTDKQFNLFQERKRETVTDDEIIQEKLLQLYVSEDSQISAYRQETDAEKTECFQGVLAAEDDGLLVPDGLNILLMRYVALINFIGDIHTKTIDIKGRIGHSIYQITDFIPTEVNGEIHVTKQIIRTIYYLDMDEPEVSVSYYLPTGHLLQHTWNNSNYSIVLNPRASFSTIPVSMTDLCNRLQNYLEELARLLEGSTESSTISCSSSDVIRAILSSILNSATMNAVSNRNSLECGSSSENVRDVLVELINQLSLS